MNQRAQFWNNIIIKGEGKAGKGVGVGWDGMGCLSFYQHKDNEGLGGWGQVGEGEARNASRKKAYSEFA